MRNLPHLPQHLNKDESAPSTWNAIRTPDPTTIRDILITTKEQKVIGLSLIHQGLDPTRSPRNLAVSIVSKTISWSTAQPSRRKRNSKTFGSCCNRTKKGSTTTAPSFFCTANTDSLLLSSCNSQERTWKTCSNLLRMTPMPSPPTRRTKTETFFNSPRKESSPSGLQDNI
jgi:hypothetical protein